MTVKLALLAHRGSPDSAMGMAPNTLEAFERARRLGADGVEFDVRLTADGALAVHHDLRIPGVGDIPDLTVHDLPDHVPLLVDALGVCQGMTVNIEIKNLPTESSYDPTESAARAVANLLEAEADLVDVVIVSSFWPLSLDAVLAVDPTIATGLLLPDWADPSQSLEMALGMGCQALHLHESLVTAAVVEETHAAGLAVAVWTVNHSATLATMAAYGVDTIITDDIPLAIATVGRT